MVVEAALRSGALNTARHARDSARPLMAVPGPVTSTAVGRLPRLIREWGAVCVTGAADVLEQLAPRRPSWRGPRRGPVAGRATSWTR